MDSMVLQYETKKRVMGKPSNKLKELQISNGTILYLDNEADIPIIEAGPPPGPMPLPELAPQKSVEEQQQKAKEEFIRKCSHGAGTRCVNCFANEKKDKEDSKKSEDTTWMCRHGPEAKCVNCVKDKFVEGIKHESFDHYMATRMAKCQHNFDARCANCLPPAEMSYKLKQCNKHPPWPAGICNSCMPATAVLSRQSYRHIDYVELMNVREITEFVKHWQGSHSLEQRGGFLYGYYAQDPNYPDGIRAVVESIYEPIQTGDMNGFHFIDEPLSFYPDMIAVELTLEKIGWIFTSINHDAFLSSFEIRNAAKYQEQFFSVHPTGYKVSKFVTVVLKPTDDGNAMPEAYMVSDQAQALERDSLFGESESRRRLVKRRAKDGELLPTIMCENKAAEEFQPEWFIVSLGCGMPKKSLTILEHSDFPPWNRRNSSRNDVKTTLNKRKNEPSFKRFSDFHLLVAIAHLVDIDTACAIAKCVTEQREVPREILELLN
jgi:nuclear protein localization family protein 4